MPLKFISYSKAQYIISPDICAKYHFKTFKVSENWQQQALWYENENFSLFPTFSLKLHLMGFKNIFRHFEKKEIFNIIL